MESNKVLLVGGNGFIGQNLRDELIKKQIPFDITDINEEDLTVANNILIDKLKDVTHVFLLASKIGAKLFNKTPIEPYFDNISILYNCIDAIQIASERYKRKYHIVWYSSSEVFGSIEPYEMILNDSYVKLNMNDARSLYSVVKLTGELLLKQMYKDKQINSLTILRLFNISGKYQRRGVLFDMINSALSSKQIEFSDKTTRTITSVQCMIDETFDTVFKNANGVVYKNITEDNNSIYMEDLTKMVSNYLISNNIVDKIDLIRNQPDNFLQYRHTGDISKYNINKVEFNKIISDVFEEVKNVREQHSIDITD